jgi:hypothetical protein
MISCASTGFLMAKPKVILFGETYPKKEAAAKIDVFVTNKPTLEYVEFAQITCNDTNDKWNLEQITNKAREIGADGIIIIGKVTDSGVGIPVGDFTYMLNDSYGIKAIAIKYK